MTTSVQSIITAGSSGLVVDIECHLSNNLPKIVIVGYANRAVDEAKERLRGAFASCQLLLPRKRITINLAPADIPKADSGFDLPIAVSIMLAGEQLFPPDLSHSAFIGELGLDGRTRPVRGMIGKLLAGRERGLTTFYIATDNLPQAELVPGIEVVPVKTLGDLYYHLNGTVPLASIHTRDGKLPPVMPAPVTNRLSEISGQEIAKRALAIAAAGGHNLLLTGPPGTGKSMLAKALVSLLPPLTREEILEVTHLHSLASVRYEQIVTERPFRSPHHSASHIAIIGGGPGALRPGEISLSHRGVLLFDEFPEFSRPTIEALRQPLEDRVISLARAKDSADFPANFILVATANPCPCGYYGTSKPCTCQPGQIAHYQRKLSGPILDRIDLFCEVNEVDHGSLLKTPKNLEAEAALRKKVAIAHARQHKRYGQTNRYNSDMTNTDIRAFTALTPDASQLIDTAAANLGVSARSYMRTLKVSRTIADLDDSDAVTVKHVTEALAYRNPTKSITG